jgi:hypothetical protein
LGKVSTPFTARPAKAEKSYKVESGRNSPESKRPLVPEFDHTRFASGPKEVRVPPCLADVLSSFVWVALQ